MTEAAITLPLDVAIILLETSKRLGIQHVKAKDRWALEVAEREIDQVRQLAEEQAGQYTRSPGYLPQFREAMAKGRQKRLI